MKNYKINKVLKSNNKFLILRCLNNLDEDVVLKISLLKSNSLEREFERLLNLAEFSDKNINYLKPRYFSKFQDGPYKSLYFYEQDYIEGLTLSSNIRNLNINELNNIDKLFFDLEKSSYDISNHLNQNNNSLTYISLESLINESLEYLSNSYFYKNLFAQEKILNNGNKLENLYIAIKKILSHKNYSEISKKPLRMILSHSNYHGDNLIFLKNKVYIIDPDVSISIVPRSFALARFIYTYVHDSADYHDYDIHTKWYSEGNPSFLLKRNISSKVDNSYKKIFGDLLNFEEKKLLFNKTKIFSIEEIKLSYLYCLLRGIKANQSNIKFLNNNNLDYFQEKGTFIYLNCLNYVNWILREL